MPGIVRKESDSAGGPLSSGSNDVYANNKKVARIGDSVTGHGRGRHGGPVMAEGASTVFANNIPVSRAGDKADCGHNATGSSNVIVE